MVRILNAVADAPDGLTASEINALVLNKGLLLELVKFRGKRVGVSLKAGGGVPVVLLEGLGETTLTPSNPRPAPTTLYHYRNTLLRLQALRTSEREEGCKRTSTTLK